MNATAKCEASGPVPLRDIEAELGRRLKAAQHHEHVPIVRARMSNLVVWCDTPEAAELIAVSLPDLMAVHPARVFLLVGQAGPGPGEETAAVQVCERPAGEGRLAYSEVVMLHATGRAVERLPFAVRGLAVGNLPINVWWACQRPPAAGGSLLHELVEHAEQILYDSAGWLDPGRGLAATANWLEGVERESGRGTWRVASDLNWRRLRTWRRVLAQALDPATAEGAIESITEVKVEHGTEHAVQAWLLLAWLTACLDWRVESGRSGKAEFSWGLAGSAGQVRASLTAIQGPAKVSRVRIACKLGGKPVSLVVSVQDGRRLAVVHEGLDLAPRTVTLATQPTAVLVGRQLSDRELDPVFRRSMEVAGVLAHCVTG
jgi:glucose-6-phosphate dehydrogenase assembly protein OpcA